MVKSFPEEQQTWIEEAWQESTMRNRFFCWIGMMAGIAVSSAAANAQTPQLFKPGEIWQSTGGVQSLSDQVPPRTPAGDKIFNANKPSYGPRAIAPALGNDP